MNKMFFMGVNYSRFKAGWCRSGRYGFNGYKKFATWVVNYKNNLEKYCL